LQITIRIMPLPIFPRRRGLGQQTAKSTIPWVQFTWTEIRTIWPSPF
jgi:hypothetical protein